MGLFAGRRGFGGGLGEIMECGLGFVGEGGEEGEGWIGERYRCSGGRDGGRGG